MNFNELFKSLDLSFLLNYEKQNESEYLLRLKSKNNEWNIKVVLENFPYKLPKSYLIDEDLIGLLSHVNENGVICLEESDSIIINYNEPLNILSLYIEKVLELLDDAKQLISKDDLLDEYEGYFVNKVKYVNAFYNTEDKIEQIALKIGNESFSTSGKPILIYDDKKGFPSTFSNVNQVNNTKVNILHIPLEIGVLPPSKKMLLDLHSYVKSLYEYIPKNDSDFINKFLNKKNTKRHNFYILFSMPRTKGERTQFLVHYYSKVKLKHPLADKETDFKIDLYFLNRNNESYLKERGGSNNNLTNKKVSIIGCGSVGSEISMMLAKSGIGELTLIDNDILTQDNIFRHRLGGSSLNYLPNDKLIVINNSKVKLLEKQIKKDIPYIKVNPKFNKFNNLLEDKDLLDSDIIIVAVGSPMESIDINMKLKKLGLNKVIFCWNEADGVGGHSVSLDLEKSCYECLYTNDEGFNNFNELSFLELGQNISKNLTGCAGVFTPFSYLDSSSTALLASKQCIEMLINNLHSQALSWKTLSNINLKVTQRFMDSNLQEVKSLESKSKCRICNE
ncbi:MAG: ThiF family adenylyltransferase [Aliarcobacter sp.]|nr:ThiF family adenylyltransferase [Aliarcobacter sp.]MDD2887766.1 ThiF family adenylyltransferase [Aliarcobacter sp.]